jgi:hypothetical protein
MVDIIGEIQGNAVTGLDSPRRPNVDQRTAVLTNLLSDPMATQLRCTSIAA